MSDTHDPLHLLVDLTTTTHTQGRSAGATRVESRFADALVRAHPDSVTLVSWSSRQNEVVEVDPDITRVLLDDDALAGAPGGAPLAPGRRGGGRTVLLVAGAGWLSNFAYLHALFAVIERLGAELHVVIHDLVHLLFPHWTPREEAARFGSHLEAMLDRANALLVYSDSTARDLQVAAGARRLALPPVRRIALGNEFAGAGESRQRRPPPECAASADQPFVLYVSAISSRKNHAFLCNVWGRLASELGPLLPRLLLVGRVAPDQEGLVDRIQRDAALRDHLTLLTGTSDEELGWLYEHCLFTVFPSLYEGWGLPVAESLAWGKVCVASNLGAVPEAAAGATPLLDPYDFASWCSTIRRFCTDRAALEDAERHVRRMYRPTTWAEASEKVWTAVSAPLEGPPRQHLAVSGTGLTFDRPCVHEDWVTVLSGGRQLPARRTRLGFPLATVPANGLRLRLGLRNLAGVPARLELDVNGASSDGWNLRPDTPVQWRTLDLPLDTLVRRGLLELVLTWRRLDGEPLDPGGPPIGVERIEASPLSSEDEAAARHIQRSQWAEGTTCFFGAGSAHLVLLREGWGEPAFWGVWSVAPRTSLSFRPMPPPAEPFVWRAGLRAFVWPSHPTLDVDVRIAGTTLARWSFDHRLDGPLVERSVVVPPDLLRDGVAHLQFDIPGCVSPRQLGMSGDDRLLGIGLVKAQCTTPERQRQDVDWLRRRRGIPDSW